MAAGVIALLLEANPELRWRDVQHITIRNAQVRVATTIFEGFGEALFKEFIMGQEPVSIITYNRPGTCINRPLH